MKRLRPARGCSGFTLIEVLVALAIVSIALVAGTQATSALTRGAQRQSDVLLAQMCAENELTKMRIMVRTTQQLPGAGDSTSTCEQANRNFTVRVEIKTTPNPNFRRIEARVLSAESDQGAILSLATIVGRV